MKAPEKMGFPKRFMLPIKLFLESELTKLKRQKNSIGKADPFKDVTRANENSLEEEVDEQVGHFEAEVKTNFLTKRIIQLRKALSMVKIGKYGICEKCGRMIDTDRLMVDPGTTMCVECKKESES